MKKNIALAFFSIVLALCLLEITLRFLTPQINQPTGPKTNWAIIPERVWTEYDPVLGWYHQKNKKAFLKKDDFEIEINTNAQGFRGKREYTIEKPPHVKRIVLLGDSFVFGWDVRDEETFASRLEQEHKNLEVLNLGVAGYGVDQILMSFRTMGRAYHPDIVLIGIFEEDFWRAIRAFSDAGYAKPYFVLSNVDQKLILKNVPVPKPFELNTNQFPEMIKRNPIERILIHSYVYRSLKRGFIRLGKYLGWIDPDTTEEWIVGRAILGQLIRDIRDSGAEPILIIIPPSRWVESKRNDSIYSSLLRFTKREHIEFIDSVQKFREAVAKSSLTDYYIKDDWHWTAKGHQLIADMVSDDLKKRGLIE